MRKDVKDSGAVMEGKACVWDTAKMELAEWIIDFSIFLEEQK